MAHREVVVEEVQKFPHLAFYSFTLMCCAQTAHVNGYTRDVTATTVAPISVFLPAAEAKRGTRPQSHKIYFARALAKLSSLFFPLQRRPPQRCVSMLQADTCASSVSRSSDHIFICI